MDPNNDENDHKEKEKSSWSWRSKFKKITRKKTESSLSFFNSPFDFIPDELMIKIFSYFDITTLTKIARVSRRFQELAEEDSVWIKATEDMNRFSFPLLDATQRGNESFKQFWIQNMILNPRKEEEMRRKRLKMAQGDYTGERDFKICIIGDRTVGKTSIIQMCTSGVSRCTSMQYIADEAPSFYNTRVVSGGKMVVFHMCDVPGDEKFTSLNCTTFKQVDAFVVCYSLMSKESLNSAINKWIPLISLAGYVSAPVFLVGCKIDQRDDWEEENGDVLSDQIISDEEMDDAWVEINRVGFSTECSSLTGEGITSLFHDMADFLLNPSRNPSIPTISDEERRTLREDSRKGRDEDCTIM